MFDKNVVRLYPTMSGGFIASAPAQKRGGDSRGAMESLGRVWRWWHLNTMVEPTPLGMEIFFALAEAGLSGQPLRMKELLVDLNHAQSAIRNTLKKLEEQGWIEFVSVETDKRAKSIVPTEKFNDYAKEFLAVAQHRLGVHF